jgi:hypothetical protein
LEGESFARLARAMVRRGADLRPTLGLPAITSILSLHFERTLQTGANFPT